MKEIISLNLGQAGVQASQSYYELFSRQHSLDPQGFKQRAPWVHFDDVYNPNTLFFETSKGKHIPRALLIDLDPDPINTLKKGPLRDLFHQEFLISANQDSSHNFARAVSSIGINFIDTTMDKIKKIAQKCQDFQGFTITNSVGGGCGSGLSSLLQEKLSQEFSKKVRMNFPIFPSKTTCKSTVQPYNSVLASGSLLQKSDISIMMDNTALYQICRRRLDVDRPENINMNRVMAKVYSGILTSFRMEAPHTNQTMSEMVANMVPFQSLNFMVSSFSPLIRANICFSGYWVDELALNMFEPDTWMVKCDPRDGKYIACTLNFSGDVCGKYINDAVRKLKENKRIQFVDWMPFGFRVEMSYKLPVAVLGGDLTRGLRESVMMANTTAIRVKFDDLGYKFDLMYKKKAYLHWYLQQGMELERFENARQQLDYLQKDYQDVIKET